MSTTEYDINKKSWRDIYKIHPAADLFPMLPEDELRKLGEDIRRRGLEHPIVLWAPDRQTEPMVIDGRNRLDAMELVGMKTFYWDKNAASPCYHIQAGDRSMVSNQETRYGIDPYELALSLNVRRRHESKEALALRIIQVMKAGEHWNKEQEELLKNKRSSLANSTDLLQNKRSVDRNSKGQVQGSTKDPLKEKIFKRVASEGVGVSKATFQKAWDKDRGPIQKPATPTAPAEKNIEEISSAAIRYLERVTKDLKRSEIAQILTAVVDHFQETHGRGFSLLKDKRVDA